MSGYVAGTGEFVKINADLCDGCERCVQVCSANVFKIQNKKAIVSKLENCFECGACYVVCPKGAVEFNYPKAGTGRLWQLFSNTAFSKQ